MNTRGRGDGLCIMDTEQHYDLLWANTPVRRPKSWRSWSIIKEYVQEGSPILELGPGTRPRFPLTPSTTAIDLSPSTAIALRRFGVQAMVGNLEKPLPFPDGAFTAVGAFDVIEHMKDDERLLSEIARVLVAGGYFLCSVPLHMEYWTLWDKFVGHYRRYEPQALFAQARRHGLLTKAAYPSEGIFQFLATTIIAHPFAMLCVAAMRFTPRLARAGERFLVVPLLRSSSLPPRRRSHRAIDMSKSFPRRCPHALFVFQKGGTKEEE